MSCLAFSKSRLPFSGSAPISLASGVPQVKYE
jgi:hypothetical protein